jgi:para-aminobenzoate synthetase component 1
MKDFLSASFINQLNTWGEQRTPFFFIIDFEGEKPQSWELDKLPSYIHFHFPTLSSKKEEINRLTIPVTLKKNPEPFSTFLPKFKHVKKHLDYGDSFLTNLSLQTPIEINAALSDLYQLVNAPYKLVWEDEFLVFSPESFIRIENHIIKTFPMKGTIDAKTENAALKILSDKKELAEHVTIVDLLRNDISQVAKNVTVNRFRYIEKIKGIDKALLQVSSELIGEVLPSFQNKFGSILNLLLPAGSVSGAPKNKTCEVIQQAEQIKRNYYTGVAGYFDGATLDSCVLIRFIEKIKNQYFYRSGAGITTQSKAESEYQELIDKIYVPLI